LQRRGRYWMSYACIRQATFCVAHRGRIYILFSKMVRAGTLNAFFWAFAVFFDVKSCQHIACAPEWIQNCSQSRVYVPNTKRSC
jgi:hypothetical protein